MKSCGHFVLHSSSRKQVDCVMEIDDFIKRTQVIGLRCSCFSPTPMGPILWELEVRGFVDTVTSQASFFLAVTSSFNSFDKTKYLILTLS